VALIVGGVGNGGKPIVDTEVYDFALGKYQQGPPIRIGIINPNLVWIGTSIFLIGGTAVEADAEEAREVQVSLKFQGK